MDKTGVPLRGVRGWLLLLCLLLTVFDPFVVLITLFAVSDGARASYEANPQLFRLILISGVLRIGLAVFSMYAGLSLWRIAPKAVSIVRLYLGSVAVMSVFLLLLPALVGLSKDDTWGLSPENLFNTLLTVVYAAIWYAYLARSRRVGATYGVGSGRDIGPGAG